MSKLSSKHCGRIEENPCFLNYPFMNNTLLFTFIFYLLLRFCLPIDRSTPILINIGVSQGPSLITHYCSLVRFQYKLLSIPKAMTLLCITPLKLLKLAVEIIQLQDESYRTLNYYLWKWMKELRVFQCLKKHFPT